MSLPKPYYSEDGITLYCGDCRDILPEFHDKSFDLCLTDPPYGVNVAEWDSTIPPQSVLDECLRVAPVSIWFGAAHPRCQAAIYALTPLPTRTYIWWNPFTLTNSGGSFWQWQPFYSWGGTLKMGADVVRMTVVEGSEGEAKYHPTQKPLSLMKKIASESQSIIDPFCGSGTTLVAAKQLGRRAVGIELSEKYCEIAVKRLAQRELFGANA